MSDPTVTIIVVPRERFSAGVESLESVYSNTDVPFKLIYIDGNSPRKLAQWLKEQSSARGFELIRSNHYLTPNDARNLGIAKARSKYVVFVDNDLVVFPGWLGSLIACAEETEAAIVTPLLLEGDGAADRIHMAGGVGKIKEMAAGNYCIEAHRLAGKRVEDVQGQLKREKTMLIEFHCVLARTDLFRAIGQFDPQLMSMAEHTDFSIMAQRAGHAIYIEPQARVVYRYSSTFMWSDLPYFYLRWSDKWTSLSLDHFQGKWNLAEDDPFLSASWRFSRDHRRLPRLHLSLISKALGVKFASIFERGLLKIYRQTMSTIVYRKASVKPKHTGMASTASR